jgi:hypothetical protein
MPKIMYFPFNHWIHFLSAWHTKQQIEILAGDIARQCCTSLIQSVISKAKTLPPEQMRGYVRAYVSCDLESVIKQHNDIKHLNPTQISKVVFQAKELLIEMVVRHAISMPPTVVVDMATAA